MQAPVLIPSAVQTEVSRICALLGMSINVATHAAPDALALSPPRNRDALYVLAITQRFSHRIPATLATIARWVGFQPGFSWQYPNRGRLADAVSVTVSSVDRRYLGKADQ